MRPLEWRIQEEAAAAASEIGPGDVPPLRLHPKRHRLSRRRGAASAWPSRAGTPHSWSRWLTPLAAAVSLAAVVVFLVVLRAGPGAGRGTWPTPGSISRAQALLARQALDAYFPASGPQYTAGLAFEWTKQKILSANTGPCLADAGFPQSPFSWSKRRFIFSTPNNGRFPDLAQRTRTHTMAPRGLLIGGHRGGQLPAARQRA